MENMEKLLKELHEAYIYPKQSDMVSCVNFEYGDIVIFQNILEFNNDDIINNHIGIISEDVDPINSLPYVWIRVVINKKDYMIKKRIDEFCIINYIRKKEFKGKETVNKIKEYGFNYYADLVPIFKYISYGYPYCQEQELMQAKDVSSFKSDIKLDDVLEEELIINDSDNIPKDFIWYKEYIEVLKRFALGPKWDNIVFENELFIVLANEERCLCLMFHKETINEIELLKFTIKGHTVSIPLDIKSANDFVNFLEYIK